MNSNIVATLQDELKKLESERARLTDPSELAELDAMIGDVRDAQTTIMKRHHERAQKAERARKRAALIPLCRTALDNFRRLNRDVETANNELLVAEQRVTVAGDRLARAQHSKPNPNAYPTPEEISAWEDRVTTAESALAKAREECRTARQARDRLNRDALEARCEFGRLEFQERMLREPNAPPEIVPLAWRVRSEEELTGVA